MALTPESQRALMDILKVKQHQSIAAPIQPKIGINPLTEAYYNYIEGDPLAQQVSGGDPLKKLLRFASEFVPGINTELAQRRGDKVGEALSYLDALGAASVPAKAVAKGAEKAAELMAKYGAQVNIAEINAIMERDRETIRQTAKDQSQGLFTNNGNQVI